MKYLTEKPQWAKHLRPYWKRIFWKSHRQEETREADREAYEKIINDALDAPDVT